MPAMCHKIPKGKIERMDIKKQIEGYREIIESNYLDVLLENVRVERKYLEIDFFDIAKANPELAQFILDNPDDALKTAEMACESFIDKEARVSIRFKTIPKSEKVAIRDIRSKHIGRLLYIEGTLKSRTDVRPQVVTARFECPSCGNTLTILQVDNQFKEPTACGCGRKGKFTLLTKEMIDVMSLTIEEDIGDIGEDTNPKKIKVLLSRDLTNPEKVADLIPPVPVRIIGQIKEVPINLRSGKKSTKFDIYLDANNFELIEDSLQRITFTPNDVKEFEHLAKDPGLVEKLTKSVAPHISGSDKIKESILLFIVKGVRKESKDKTIRSRDFFHILLVGDPGSGKSEFGKEVNNISYKSKKAVGKGASGVGLTASAEKDELLGERVLSAGTIPTCNEGHAVIDEVDKMEDEVQSHLLDCMENGEINITKSRVQGRLKANVGIFMIANPKAGRFDMYSPLAGQIRLSQPLISRFDLIFPVIDKPDRERDEALIDTILSKHKNIEDKTKREIEFKLMRKYLCYVSRNIRPKLSDEAYQVIKRYSKDMRLRGIDENGQKNNNTISITARQIESLIRISEAYAKLRMSKEVSGKDAKHAIAMVEYYLESFAMDKDTGKIDIDRIATGISSSERHHMNEIKIIIEDIVKQIGNKIPIDDVIKRASEKGISEELVESAIEKLKGSGDIFEPRRGFISKL